MQSPKGKHPDAVTAADGAAVQLRHLMRSIVTVTAANQQFGPAEGSASGPENVLVDTELDGMRYLLIQMPGTEQNRSLLSPRELEIVRMVAQGHQNKTIAGILNISTWTVCAHVRRIFAKLGVSSRAAMVARLLQNDARTKSSGTATRNGSHAHSRLDPVDRLADFSGPARPVSESGSDKRMANHRIVESGDSGPRTAARANVSLSDKRGATV